MGYWPGVSGYHEYPRCHAKSDELGFAKVVVCAEVAAAAPVELSEAAQATNCKYNRTLFRVEDKGSALMTGGQPDARTRNGLACATRLLYV